MEFHPRNVVIQQEGTHIQQSHSIQGHAVEVTELAKYLESTSTEPSHGTHEVVKKSNSTRAFLQRKSTLTRI
jgi:hypothetical protein